MVDEANWPASADAIKEKFPLLYGQPVVTFEQTEVAPDAASPLKVPLASGLNMPSVVAPICDPLASTI